MVTKRVCHNGRGPIYDIRLYIYIIYIHTLLYVFKWGSHEFECKTSSAFPVNLVFESGLPQVQTYWKSPISVGPFVRFWNHTIYLYTSRAWSELHIVNCIPYTYQSNRKRSKNTHFQETLFRIYRKILVLPEKTADWRNFLSVSLFGNLGTPLWTCLYGEMNLRINKQTHVWSCLTCYSCWHPYFQVVFLALFSQSPGNLTSIPFIIPLGDNGCVHLLPSNETWQLKLPLHRWFSMIFPLKAFMKGYFPASHVWWITIGGYPPWCSTQLGFFRNLTRPSFQMPCKHCLRERRNWWWPPVGQRSRKRNEIHVPFLQKCDVPI